MKKYEKGTCGYLDYQKNVEIIRTVVYFLIVAAVYFLGYSQTGTNKNLLTVVAIVGCLPACKALVGVIIRFPHHSLRKETAKELMEKCPHLTVLFDLVVTSTEKIMPIDEIVVSGNQVLGYSSSQKTDLSSAEKHIRNILVQNHFQKVSVKLTDQYNTFLTRAGELEKVAEVETEAGKTHEQKIAQLIMNISL